MLLVQNPLDPSPSLRRLNSTTYAKKIADPVFNLVNGKVLPFTWTLNKNDLVMTCVRVHRAFNQNESFGRTCAEPSHLPTIETFASLVNKRRVFCASLARSRVEPLPADAASVNVALLLSTYLTCTCSPKNHASRGLITRAEEIIRDRIRTCVRGRHSGYFFNSLFFYLNVLIRMRIFQPTCLHEAF